MVESKAAMSGDKKVGSLVALMDGWKVGSRGLKWDNVKGLMKVDSKV